MSARKSPAQGEAPIVPGKVDRHRNIIPVTGGPHADFVRVTSPHAQLEPSTVPGWWNVILVAADQRETKCLSSRATRSEAVEALKGEAECRGLTAPAIAIVGGAHV